jgi:hypothetical protein
MQRGTRTREIAEISLREMVAHLNVLEASIDVVGKGAGLDIGVQARDFLSRLQVLAFCAARLRIADVPKVTDALEDLVLSSHIGRSQRDDDVIAALRHGVDVLMLLTHDTMRRMQGYPAAELRPATDALLARVSRLISDPPNIAPAALKVAGL